MRLPFLVGLFFLLLSGILYAATTITRVEIEGLVRTDRATVMSVIKSLPGSAFNIKMVDSDIINIYDLGFYRDVRAYFDRKTGVLTFAVKEKPSIRFITFSGNKKVSDKELLKACVVKQYQILSLQRLRKSVDKMLGLYASKGMYLTAISYKVEPVPNNRVDIEFQIKESKSTYIKRIDIIGNKHIPTKEILGVMENHRKYGPYILTFLPWFYTGTLYVGKLSSDIGRIRDLYQSKGYIDVRVDEPMVTFEPDTGYIYIDIVIHEGGQYILRSIDFENIAPLSLEKVKRIVDLRPGGPFNLTKLRKGIEKLTNVYGDLGYAFADINPIITTNRKEHTATVKLVVDKGPKIYINRIEVVGNTKTHDNVIRRELLLKQGSLYSYTKLKKSRINLFKTNYFKTVKIQTRRVDHKNKMNVIVKVKEKPTGMLSLGVGYSSYYHFGVNASISETNLVGTGVMGYLSGSVTSKSALYNLKLVNPWIFNRPISVGINLYNQRYSGWDYDEHATGGSLTVAKRFWENELSIGASYSLDFNNVSATTSNPGYYLREQEGNHIESAVTPFVKVNTLNSPYIPTNGFIASTSVRMAGLGGTERYMKVVSEVGYYHELVSDLVGHVRGEVGYLTGLSGKTAPIGRRFFLGGINDLRGFSTGTVSPTDSSGNYIGGNRELFGTTELIFPVISALKFYGVAFFDVGNTWLNKYDFGNLKEDAGVGLRWFSPIGVIRMAIGRNLHPTDGEKSVVFQFSMGTSLF